MHQQSLTQLQQVTQDVDAGFEKTFEQSTQHLSALREHSGALAREQRMELGQIINHAQVQTTNELKALRENQTTEAQTAREHLLTQLTQTTTQLVQQLQTLNETTERRLNHMRENIETRLSSIEAKNSEKLEQMRVTVDENSMRRWSNASANRSNKCPSDWSKSIVAWAKCKPSQLVWAIYSAC